MTAWPAVHLDGSHSAMGWYERHRAEMTDPAGAA